MVTFPLACDQALVFGPGVLAAKLRKTHISRAKAKSQKTALEHETRDRVGGGGTPLYGLYKYVRPQRVWFFIRFGHNWSF